MMPSHAARRRVLAPLGLRELGLMAWAGRGGWSVVLVGLIATAGCGWSGQEGRKLVPVSGVVTLDGTPLPDGFVSFVSSQEGRFETFPIKEGRYAGKAGPGTRTVEIIAIREAGPTSGSDREPPKAVRENYLPAKYSTNSTLKAEVKEAGLNVFDFELTMGGK